MRKNIALAGKINAKHRSRQNLGHGTFGNDLFFLRHRAANILTRARRSRLVPQTSGGSANRENASACGTDNIPAVQVTEIVPAKALANIRVAPLVSTTRRFGEVLPAS